MLLENSDEERESECECECESEFEVGIILTEPVAAPLLFCAGHNV